MSNANQIIAYCFVIVLGILTGCSSEEPSQNLNLGNYLYDSSILSDTIHDASEYHSILLTNCECYDSINNHNWRYNVLLPKDYSEEKEYNILYLLHGRSLTYHIWVSELKLQETIEHYYKKNDAIDLVVIMPEALETYYVDDFKDDIKYESFFLNIFMPTVERIYNIKNESKSRFIGGFSMGGYGSMYYTFKYPGLFSFCFSACAPLDGNNNVGTPSVFNYIEKDKDYYPHIIIDVGKDDYLCGVNLKSTLALRGLHIPHEFILRDGAHTAEFWTESLMILFDRLVLFYQ